MLDKFATTPPPPPQEGPAKVRMQVELPFQMGSTQFGKYIAATLPADFQVCICWAQERGTLRATLGELFSCAKPYVTTVRAETGREPGVFATLLFIVQFLKA